MKSLIRPFLFGFVRLGAFFAVTAWIVGTFRYVRLTISRGPSDFVVGCEREGWIVYRPFISYRPFNPQDGVRLSSGIREPGRKVSEYRLLKEGLVPGTETTQIEGCGLEILWLDGWFIVTIRHWVIVVFWLLCYLSLKYFYRKRPVTEPEADL